MLKKACNDTIGNVLHNFISHTASSSHGKRMKVNRLLESFGRCKFCCIICVVVDVAMCVLSSVVVVSMQFSIRLLRYDVIFKESGRFVCLRAVSYTHLTLPTKA